MSSSAEDSSGALNIEDVRRAQAALDGLDVITWANRFELLSDANRLRLLLCLHHAPGICVTDLSVALGMSGTAVSHALRLLRSQGWVTATRDGRSMRYQLAEDTVHQLLHSIGATHFGDTQFDDTGHSHR
ncbi:ArsR/SmtB family transcription factor [Rhodococcus sp. OK302]|uniref:ArsR/SmtB family transcription factor n=1 Tax=Rhodococcus sp. OK302 TaxID=1882769 RepID=UPI000B9F3E20|nr:helix-turn-helix domain-containing protein [Rhodococcus sp. OK302]OYD66918.1 DNA-binding transcriptional ArsR family regulator [Rhodococcus sp. OK302]